MQKPKIEEVRIETSDEIITDAQNQECIKSAIAFEATEEGWITIPENLFEHLCQTLDRWRVLAERNESLLTHANRKVALQGLEIATLLGEIEQYKSQNKILRGEMPF